ncbi:MAG TPA: hypothetical protein VJA27_01225 [Patescibacteria group bacterium]|nr:hypothetical protein [Patescibacteria group bacterium]
MPVFIIPFIPRPADMPAWQDCGWRRDVCGKKECRLCGMQRRTEQTILLEEALDDIPQIAADNAPQEKEWEQMGRWDDGLERDAGGFNLSASRGFEHSSFGRNAFGTDAFEGPNWQKYPLFRTLRAVQDRVWAMYKEADTIKASWIETEAAHDLMWYVNLLPPKTGRLLDARNELDRGDEFVDWEYDYMRYVLAQSFQVLERAFLTLRMVDGVPEEIFNIEIELVPLTKEIFEI